MCSPAPACVAARKEATKRWPMRNQASDGICSSADHRKRSPNSDHDFGNAVDITHDPARGVDCNILAEIVRRDPRTKYVIWNRRISNPSIQNGKWRPYNGSNPHTRHIHISIYPTARNDLSPWFQGDDIVTDADIDKIVNRVVERIAGPHLFGKPVTLHGLALWTAELAKEEESDVA